MKIISFEDVRSLNISPETCFSWVSDMILHKQNAILPAKVHLNGPGNIFCNVMPCIVNDGETRWGGVKTVTRYPERTPALDSKIILYNADMGEFAAFVDGNWITAMRTGAVAAHSIINFAKKGFAQMGFIGLGNTARSTLIVLAAMCPDRDLDIKLLRYKNQAELFAERFSGNPRLHFSVVDTPEQTIHGSDVVVSCATYFENDICPDEYFDEGVLVVPVHTRGFTNCDLFFDKVFADDTGHVDHFRNFARFRSYAEVSDVVNRRAPGRENDSERILAYNIGVAMHDVKFAALIYNAFVSDPAKFAGLADIDMHDPKLKFWI